jgi:anti-sigma28 factor (negative regulator of flagellin synthesis)
MHLHPAMSLEGPFWLRRRGQARQASSDPNRNEPAPSPEPAADPRPFRADLVARIRQAIAEGRYGTDEQLEQALEEFLRRYEQGQL